MRLFNVLLMFLFLSTGCAYKFGYYERNMPDDHKNIFISSFKNNTQETGVEVYFAKALVRKFYRSKLVKLTKKNQASAYLKGVIERIQFVPATQSQILDGSVILNTEYRLLVTVHLSLVEASSLKIIWEDKFIDERVYSAPQVTQVGVNSVNPNYDHSKRYEIFQFVANKLMSKAHDRMVERF